MIRTHIPIASSNLQSIGYDDEARVLEVAFKGSGTYEYFNVPADVYAGLSTSESAGKYFHANVKGKYQYKKKESGQ